MVLVHIAPDPILQEFIFHRFNRSGGALLYAAGRLEMGGNKVACAV